MVCEGNSQDIQMSGERVLGGMSLGYFRGKTPSDMVFGCHISDIPLHYCKKNGTVYTFF